MSLFDIKPWLVKKNDGTKKQVMPQTTIKGVIGLEKKLNSIETFIENLTGKKFDKNYQNNFLTKNNLEDYVTTNKLTQSETNSKGYADSIAANLKNSLPNFNGNIQDNDDLDNFKKRGIYYRDWRDTIVKNAPTNDNNSKAGVLIVFDNVWTIQIFISAVADSQVYIRNYSGIPSVWQSWRRIANDNDINNLKGQITDTENRLTQKINDSNKGLFHFETVTGQTDPTLPDPYNKRVVIKAPNVPGYSFAFWLNSSTSGTVLPNYIDSPNFQQIGIWISIPDGNTTPVKINACAVYVKSTVA